jgi:hypothetical protein
MVISKPLVSGPQNNLNHKRKRKMRITICLSILITLSFSAVFGQDKFEKDREAILSMCGCHEVSFNFAETFNYSEDSNYTASPTKHMYGLEWVQLVEDKGDKIVLQHILVVKVNDTTGIVKHWRQDWIYENTEFYDFHVDKNWHYAESSPDQVKGQWTQKVFQVDDSPRYEASGSWVYVDGRTYWASEADAPLPRREFSIRDDYNVTYRRNLVEITDKGWVHEQDNDKLIRTEGKEDFILAQEKGYNFYDKVKDEKCQPAIDYWHQHQEMWEEVRAFWDEVFAQKSDLKLSAKVEGKLLFEYLFALKPNVESEEIHSLIAPFVQ